LVDLGPTKTLQPKFGVVSVMNENSGENSFRQTETKIAEKLLTGTKPTYDEIEKDRKNVFAGWKHRHSGI
jgi:hypothetical protein